MSGSLSETNLEKKFRGVTSTQDSIQTLSLWLMHHKAHHQQIVSTWLRVLKKAKINHRLTLFYVANDVIQNSKRKSISTFKESFGEVLKEATLLVREDQIRNSVNRVFTIWGERSIYPSDFIADLQGILANAKVPASVPSKLLSDFKSEDVINKLKDVGKLEQETSTKAASLNLTKLNATNAEIVRKLKDRTHGQQFSREFDENARVLEEVVNSLTKELEVRNELVLLLEQSEIYYDSQQKEAKIVAHAFKNFASRVKALQKKLEELMSTFPSPIPSPCIDAPSPSSDSEAELMLPDAPAEKKDIPAVSNMSVSLASVSQGLGQPIPTLSSLFQPDKNEMPSWLDTFSNKKVLQPQEAVSTVPKNNDSGSLDTRLSNLLQNLPNLPAGLQTTLFGTSGTEITLSDSATNSPAPFRKGATTAISFSSDANTPIKDEYSGQNTPLQDEDTPLSGASSFFTQLRASKGSQSPKDILKGLTNMIHSASSNKSKSSNRQTGNHENHKGNNMKNVTPTDFNSSGSPSMYLNSPHTATSASNVPENTSFIPPTNSQTKLFSPFENDAKKNFSYIPSLVPSSSTTSHSSYAECEPVDQNYEMDMDLDSECNSPANGQSDDAEPTKSAPLQDVDHRQSTLITLVTDNKPEQEQNPCEKHTDDKDGILEDQSSNWPPPTKPDLSGDQNLNILSDSASGSNVLSQPGDNSQQEPDVSYARDDRNEGYNNQNWSPSKIQTVQSLRTIEERPWPDNNNDWYGFESQERPVYGNQDQESYSQNPVKYNNYYPKKTYPSTPYHERKNWQDYNRQFQDFRQKNYDNYQGRGRGWRRSYQQPY